MELFEPLPGHSQAIRSICISPDGTYLVSGSNDRGICVWNLREKSMILDPLVGHSGPVNSVCFSHDGNAIVSESDDGSIRMWDIQIGVQVAIFEPPDGDAFPVIAVACASSVPLIASGTYSGILCVWSFNPSKLLLGPLKPHNDSIESVAFSPDDSRIVTGSMDDTIYTLDTQTGVVVLGPIGGHTSWIYSVGFSPAESGEMVQGPLRGHTGVVDSVAFVPDGTHIVSASWDNAIRVWDIRPRPSIEASDPDHAEWEMNKEGWIVDTQFRHLVWLNPKLGASLIAPRNTALFSHDGYVKLHFEGVRTGESWAEIYQPD